MAQERYKTDTDQTDEILITFAAGVYDFNNIFYHGAYHAGYPLRIETPLSQRDNSLFETRVFVDESVRRKLDRLMMIFHKNGVKDLILHVKRGNTQPFEELITRNKQPPEDSGSEDVTFSSEVIRSCYLAALERSKTALLHTDNNDKITSYNQFLGKRLEREGILPAFSHDLVDFVKGAIYELQSKNPTLRP